MGICRNCGSPELRELGSIGKIAPFFLKRVFQIEMRVPVSPHPLKEFVRRIGRPGQRLFSKIYSKEAYLAMEICMDCSFVQTKYPFPEAWITRLYQDYRSDSYNRERIRFEPGYRLIADRVGVDRTEIANRVQAATEFLKGKLEIGPEFTMLGLWRGGRPIFARSSGRKVRLRDLGHCANWGRAQSRHGSGAPRVQLRSPCPRAGTPGAAA